MVTELEKKKSTLRKKNHLAGSANHIKEESSFGTSSSLEENNSPRRGDLKPG
jgi:hypothetical protein